MDDKGGVLSNDHDSISSMRINPDSPIKDVRYALNFTPPAEGDATVNIKDSGKSPDKRKSKKRGSMTSTDDKNEMESSFDTYKKKIDQLS